MASFWSRLQIPSLISSKENGHQTLLLRGSSIATENIRSFFWKSRKPIEYGTGNCGQPLPERIEPCKGCPSKCLEEPVKVKRKGLFGLKKKPDKIKQKPSNCKEEKPAEEKLTWWEMIFGPDPKRSWPDPCTCRLVHRRRRTCRTQDPRLTDPRYEETAGDVFLYTEIVKRKGRPCLEPQPKPPPSFKVPKEVLFRKLCVDEMGSFKREFVKNDEHPGNVCLEIKPPRIPYEELRPPERRKQLFHCKRGIRSEDVLQPIKKDSNFYRTPSTTSQLNLYENVGRLKQKESVRETQSDQVIRKRSRIEELKFLVRQKDTLHCMSGNS